MRPLLLLLACVMAVPQCVSKTRGCVHSAGRELQAKEQRVWERLEDDSGPKPGGACAIGDQTKAGSIEPDAAPASDLVFNVQTSRVIGRISPWIYGTNGAPHPDANRQTLLRLGGNRTSAYNWENNASNAGRDWNYQSDGYLEESDQPAKAALDVIEQAKALGAEALITIPIGDYVSADKLGDGDVRKSPRYLETRFRKNRARKASQFSKEPDLHDSFVNQDEFVDFLKRAEPAALPLFALDNEPDLWAETHPEVHPKKVSYEELVQRTIEYATAIKDVMPEAKVLGFVSYGWHGYTTLQDAPDGRGRGEFIDYFLSTMQKAERQNKRRLVDYLDLHWYSEAVSPGGERVTDSKKPEVIASRMQAPRSLWDPSYHERSWIAKKVGAIELLPRLREKISKLYPGTGLAITEWNFGGGDDITGTLVSADILGIFGCRGVAIAANWGVIEQPFTELAFRAFRNFDGRGGTFGDVAVFSSSSDYKAGSVYASTDSRSPGRVIALVLNKTPQTKHAALRVAAPVELNRAETYSVSQGSADFAPGVDAERAGRNVFRFEMRPYSVNVLVMR